MREAEEEQRVSDRFRVAREGELRRGNRCDGEALDHCHREGQQALHGKHWCEIGHDGVDYCRNNLAHRVRGVSVNLKQRVSK